MTAAGRDPDVKFSDQLLPVPDSKKIDVKEYLNTVILSHADNPTYKMDETAVERVVIFEEEFRAQGFDMENNILELEGVLNKSVTNILKLAMVVACLRETMEKIDTGWDQQFVVLESDVEAAGIIVKDSINCFKTFKVNVFQIIIL